MALTSTIWWSCSTVWSNVTFQTVSVGGEEAVVNEFPWAALLHLRSSETNQTSRCGGSLITDRHVLTAGHCLRESADNGEIDDVYNDITVVLGEMEIIICQINMFFYLFILIYETTQLLQNSGCLNPLHWSYEILIFSILWKHWGKIRNDCFHRILDGRNIFWVKYTFSGDHDLDDDTETVEFLSKALKTGLDVHPKFFLSRSRGVIKYDVGLLTLETPVDFTNETFSHIRWTASIVLLKKWNLSRGNISDQSVWAKERISV